MGYVLKVVEGQAEPDRHDLVEDQVLIGRDRACGVLIEYPAVSRRHARLLRGREGYLLEDLGSRNKTYVNGKKVQQRVLLKPGDRITICETTFLFQADLPATEENAEEYGGSTVLSTIDVTSAAAALGEANSEARLHAMLRITQALGATLDLPRVLSQMLDGLFEVFPAADRGLVLLCDGDRLIPQAVKVRRESAGNVRYSRTIVSKVIAQRRAILSEDVRQDRQLPSESILGLPIRSVMCAPLLAQDSRVLGVIQLDTDDPRRRFGGGDLEILTTVAVQAAISIQFTQLHGERVRHARLERELELAKDVQHSFLPLSDPDLPGYSFWSHYQSAAEVGGDFYDYLEIPGGRHAVLLGDVAGKGIPAALMMAKISASCKQALLLNPGSLRDAMIAVNRDVCGSPAGMHFITLVVCMLDPASHEITLASAGHMSPIVLRRDGTLQEPADEKVRGLPVGVTAEFCYETATIRLDPGECVVLYSDGLSDAMNPAREPYSIAGIRQQLSALIGRSPSEIGGLLLEDVQRHMGDCDQFDDMSLVVFGRSAEPA